MSVSTRIFFTVLCGFAAYALVVVLAQRTFVASSFEELEKIQARQDMGRVISALDNELHHLDTLTQDWAEWDDSYDFVRDRNQGYIDSNLIPETFRDTELNLIALYDNSGQVVWSRVYDPETDAFVQAPDFPEQGPCLHPEILAGPDDMDGVRGIFQTGRGALLLATWAVTTSLEDAPPVGTLVMGRYVDQALVDRMADQVDLRLSVWSATNQDIPLEILDQARGMVLDEPARVAVAGPNRLHVLQVYPDLTGLPALLIQATLNRPVTQRGNRAMAFDQMAVIIGGVVALLLVHLSIQALVVWPVGRLTAQVVSRGQSPNPLDGDRLTLDRTDEIGTLSREFEALLERLTRARRELAQSAHRAGQSEMAQGLVHNLRNTMTPLVSHLDLILADLRSASLEDQERARSELAEGNAEPQRRDKIESFLSLAAERNAHLLGKTVDQLTELTRRADAIERVVNDFERFTKADTLTESVILEDLVHEALDLIPTQLRVHAKLDTQISLPEGRLRTNPPILLQVLVHLLSNAAEAVAARVEAEGRDPDERAAITIRAWSADQGVRINVEDKGLGIDPQDLQRIFDRDYTTSKDPRRGFGLHWCSGVLNQLGGRLTAHSMGPGQGATFTILLPENHV